MASSCFIFQMPWCMPTKYDLWLRNYKTTLSRMRCWHVMRLRHIPCHASYRWTVRKDTCGSVHINQCICQFLSLTSFQSLYSDSITGIEATAKYALPLSERRISEQAASWSFIRRLAIYWWQYKGATSFLSKAATGKAAISLARRCAPVSAN